MRCERNKMMWEILIEILMRVSSRNWRLLSMDYCGCWMDEFGKWFGRRRLMKSLWELRVYSTHISRSRQSLIIGEKNTNEKLQTPLTKLTHIIICKIDGRKCWISYRHVETELQDRSSSSSLVRQGRRGSQYGKLGRYYWTSSFAKWAKRSIDSIFHLLVQF